MGNGDHEVLRESRTRVGNVGDWVPGQRRKGNVRLSNTSGEAAVRMDGH